MRMPRVIRDVRTIRRLLEGAEAHARAMGDAEPGAEHLLLAALDLDDATAARALAAAGGDPDGLGDAIAAVHAEALASVGVPGAPAPAPLAGAAGGGVYRSAPSAQDAFQAATALAREAEGLLGCHVVEAVAGLEHGTAARALAHMGVDRTALIAAARDARVGAP